MNKMIRWLLPMGLLILLGTIYNSNFFQKNVKQELQNNVHTNENVTKSGNLGEKIIDKLGGHFKLIDQNGNEFNSQNHNDKYKMIYFGFSRCKSVCPTVLLFITEVLNNVDEDPVLKEKLMTIFISVDKNETPETLRAFHEKFHPSIMMLTGEKPLISTIAELYKVYYDKEQEKNKVSDDYDINHTSIIYFVNRDNEYVSAFSTNDPTEKILTILRNHLK